MCSRLSTLTSMDVATLRSAESRMVTPMLPGTAR